MKPRIPLLNPAFPYVHSSKTDISVKIKAERERLEGLKKPKAIPLPFERQKR